MIRNLKLFKYLLCFIILVVDDGHKFVWPFNLPEIIVDQRRIDMARSYHFCQRETENISKLLWNVACRLLDADLAKDKNDMSDSRV